MLKDDGNAATRDCYPEDLVRLAVQGCDEAISGLAEYFRPRLIHLLRRRLSQDWQRLDVEDVAQVALSKAFLNIAKFDFQYKFSTWLYTIAFRAAHDQLRQNRRWWAFRSFPAELTSAASEESARQTEARDSAENIWAIAQRLLTSDQYTALWLRYSEELSVAEIAKLMSRNPGGVRVLLHRSRLALLEHLDS